MSSACKRPVSRIEDVILGAFGNLQPSETLNHLVRYLSTWNGSECVLSSFLFDIKWIQRKCVTQQTIHGNELSSFSCARPLADTRLVKLIQYGAKLLIPILQARARLQHRAGIRNEPISFLVPRLTKLASIIGDARTLWGIWGTCFTPTFPKSSSVRIRYIS